LKPTRPINQAASTLAITLSSRVDAIVLHYARG
jgi:hypothetical protein